MDRRTWIAITLGALAIACASGAIGPQAILYRTPDGLPARADAAAEDDAELSGIVSLDGGGPATNAWVTIEGAGLPAPLDLATDAAGAYLARGLPAGAYSVRVRYRSYDIAKMVSLKAGETARSDMLLHDRPLTIT